MDKCGVFSIYFTIGYPLVVTILFCLEQYFSQFYIKFSENLSGNMVRLTNLIAVVIFFGLMPFHARTIYKQIIQDILHVQPIPKPKNIKFLLVVVGTDVVIVSLTVFYSNTKLDEVFGIINHFFFLLVDPLPFFIAGVAAAIVIKQCNQDDFEDYDINAAVELFKKFQASCSKCLFFCIALPTLMLVVMVFKVTTLLGKCSKAANGWENDIGFYLMILINQIFIILFYCLTMDECYKSFKSLPSRIRCIFFMTF